MTGHATDMQPYKPGAYTEGYLGLCACGWHGPIRPTQGAASRDCLDHARNPQEDTT